MTVDLNATLQWIKALDRDAGREEQGEANKRKLNSIAHTSSDTGGDWRVACLDRERKQATTLLAPRRTPPAIDYRLVTGK